MKQFIQLKYKMGLVAILTLIITALLVNNLAGRKYASDLNASFDAIYKDRLLASNYLYGINNALHEKHDLLANGENYDEGVKAAIVVQNNTLADMARKYGATELTSEESQRWQQLRMQLDQYDLLENRLLHHGANDLNQLNLLYKQNQHLLQELTNLQASEGKVLRKNSRAILLNTTAMGQAEITLLIVLGLLAVAISSFTEKNLFANAGRHQLN
jgi:hypothetical protein